MVLIMSGSAHPTLAAAVASELHLPLVAVDLLQFPDAEVVRIEESVRGGDLYIVQPTPPPSERHLFELLLLADASHRAGAARITAVVPFLGYSRQDRRAAAQRVAVGARVVADMLGTGNIDRIVTVDLHQPSVEGFFSIPVEHLEAYQLHLEAIREYRENAVVVAPDLGASKLADRFARDLDLPFAVVHKERLSGVAVAASRVTGDVSGRTPIIVDDMITTGGTVRAAVGALLAAGALPHPVVAATHGIVSDEAPEVLAGLELRRLLLTDSVPLNQSLPNLRVVGLAGLLAEAIRRLSEGRSLADFRSQR
ncbi:MAG: ribose-phosphate diphosphokinase [Dehalococcoidia bacterium]